MSTAKAIEYMVIDALLAAEPYEMIAEQVEKPDKYVFLTDEIMAKIESSTAPVRPFSFRLSGFPLQMSWREIFR